MLLQQMCGGSWGRHGMEDAHPPHAEVTVSPRMRAVAQNPGKVSTEFGCAADVVWSRVLMVTKTTSPISSLLFTLLFKSPDFAPA